LPDSLGTGLVSKRHQRENEAKRREKPHESTGSRRDRSHPRRRERARRAGQSRVRRGQ
jgi:hypothetical protein